MTPRSPRTTLFPYTTLFRSCRAGWQRARIDGQLCAVLRVRDRGARAWLRGPAEIEMRLTRFRAFGARGVKLKYPSRSWSGVDRKSTRLNSSHGYISYAVFCLNDTALTPNYTLSLHDALPILSRRMATCANRRTAMRCSTSA